MLSSTFLAASLSFISRRPFGNRFGLLTGSKLALLGVDGLEHLDYQLHFAAGSGGKHIAVEMNCAALVPWSAGTPLPSL